MKLTWQWLMPQIISACGSAPACLLLLLPVPSAAHASDTPGLTGTSAVAHRSGMRPQLIGPAPVPSLLQIDCKPRTSETLSRVPPLGHAGGFPQRSAVAFAVALVLVAAGLITYTLGGSIYPTTSSEDCYRVIRWATLPLTSSLSRHSGAHCMWLNCVCGSILLHGLLAHIHAQ